MSGPLPAKPSAAPAREGIDARFEILGETGAGGMGTVYQAIDRESGRKVALKIVSSGAGNYARFALEAEVLSRLDHPGIVSYVGYGEAAEGPWLAMEWLEGETLSDALEAGPFDVRATLAFATALIEALVVAHENKIVHRDLKPSNLFLIDGQPGAVKVLDFGVARLREEHRDLTLTNQIVGTPGYMSPEQARGQRHIDARADLFSLGCVLFRVLTGVPPFDGPDVLSVLAKLATQDPPPVGELVDDVPEPLERLIVTLLAKAPADRPTSAEAVREELVRIMALVVDGPAIHRPRRGHAGERLIECVVLARPADDGTPVSGDAATMAGDLSDATFVELRDRIASAGGRLRILGGGALLVHVDEHESSAGRAQAAARCASILSEAHWQVSIAAGASERVPASDGRSMEATLADPASDAMATGQGRAIDRASATLAEARPGAVRVAAASSELEQAFHRELLRALRDAGTSMEMAPTALAPAGVSEGIAPVSSVSAVAAPLERSRWSGLALALLGSVLGALIIGGVWWRSGEHQAPATGPAASSSSPASPTVTAMATMPATGAIPDATPTASSSASSSAAPPTLRSAATAGRPAARPGGSAAGAAIPAVSARPTASSGPARETW